MIVLFIVVFLVMTSEGVSGPILLGALQTAVNICIQRRYNRIDVIGFGFEVFLPVLPQGAVHLFSPH